MGSFFQNISIKLRFRILLIGIITAFLAIIIFFGITLSNVKKYHDYDKSIDNLTQSYLNVRRYEQYFLSRYNEDPGFFTTNENKYLKKHETATKEFENILSSLNQNKLTNKLTKKLNLSENLNRIGTIESNYNQIFQNLVNKIIKRGSMSTGIIGNLYYSAEQALRKSESLYLSNYLLTLNQSGDNYLFTRDPVHYKHFITSFLKLNQELNTNTAPDSSIIQPDSIVDISSSKVSLDFVKSMNDYKQYFTALVNIDKEIGLTYQEGLQGQLRNEITKFDPEIEELSEKIALDKSKALGSIYNSIYIFAAFVALFLVYLILKFSSSITRPVEKLTNYIIPLSKGNLPDKVDSYKGTNELAQIFSSVNELINGLKQTTNFAITIGKGVFDTNYNPLSKEDKLGNALIEMRQNLNQAKIEEEKRKKEDDMRKWANEGLANFNDILRQSTGDIKKLSDIVIKELVQFLNANQAGLFIFNNTDPTDAYYELAASYAFGHEKKKEKKIYPGEGLVGTVAIEKETVYMTDIPQSYITITSGLGGANPRSLLIVPMRVEDEVFGVIEIASFNNFKSHEIEFVEKVSENIAASLSISRINSKTAFLLEQSQLQAEQMASQEQEMRHNFEELQLAQEESARREAEMTSILSAIDNSSLVIEIDTKGFITSVNRGLLDLLGVPESDVVGKMHQDFIQPEDENEYLRFWLKVKEGEHIQLAEHFTVDGNEFWLQVVYAAILDDLGNVVKILSLATDFTEAKQFELELKEKAKLMHSQEEMMRKNLNELRKVQDEMASKQMELEEINMKSQANDKKLRKESEKTGILEKEIKELEAQIIKANDKIIEMQAFGGLTDEYIFNDDTGKIKLETIDKKSIIAKYNIDGTLIHANELFYKIFAYAAESINGKHIRILITPEDRKSDEYFEFLKKIRTGEKIEGEFRRVNSQGNTLYFKGYYIPLRNSAGEVYEFIEILDDISKQKTLENETTDIANFLNQTNCVVYFNEKGLILKANKIFADSVKMKTSEIEGKEFKNFSKPEYAESIEYLHLWRDLSRGELVSGIFTAIDAEGNEIKYDAAFSGIKNIAGEIKKIIFVGKVVIEDNI